MWETFTNWLTNFFNEPVVISITTVLSTLGAFLLFLSKTSFGKKAIYKLTELGHRVEKKVNDIGETVEAHKKEVQNEVVALKENYEQKIAIVLSIANFYEQSFFEIASLIPNAKVQAKVTEVREVYEAKKKVIENEIGLIYDDFETAVIEKTELIEKEYADKYHAISQELENLKLQIQPFQRSVDEILDSVQPVEEEPYEQETENTEPTQETI